VRFLFLFAYTSSGLAGLIYEVSWTRLLTLYIGHTTAAASAVVAAFLGGLAVGAGAGGRVAARLSRMQSLYAYIGLEVGVIVLAVALPFELAALKPVLSWAYDDGAGGALFGGMRVLACLVMVFVPAVALGATFPMAIRWFAAESENPARASGTLYAVNTVGAAVGSILAGFVLIPLIGLHWTIGVAMSASLAAAVAAALVRRSARFQGSRVPKFQGSKVLRDRAAAPAPFWVPAAVLGISGFAALMHEIAWTRILSLVLGPTIYAFAGTLAAVIAGVACGSAIGSWMVGRIRHAGAWLAFSLAASAITASYTYSLAGTTIPALVAEHIARAPDDFDSLLRKGIVLTAALITPTSICLGAAFPLALALVGEVRERARPGPSTTSRSPGAESRGERANVSRGAARKFALIYSINTIGAVSGSLAAGFLFIPLVGLETTLRVVTGCLVFAALLVAAAAGLTKGARSGALLASGAAAVILIFSPPWDRELLASGVYMYAPFVPEDLDLETQLKAGTLLYYREGAPATVSVKRLTGTTTLAVDGKTDASNRGDMLTQKLVAHLPLLLHESPREVAIIGLGSGVTVGSALRHPIERADVIEISPEVVEASRFFDRENHNALADPRTNLIIGDGRSHLLLSKRTYDVIISEPSNPWIAGVASLFTREFFLGVRDRLAPNGVVCQWANAYNISDRDLRSIVATFISVFPDGMAWLVGADDLLLVGSREEVRLANIERHWRRPGVAEDLALVSAVEPFSVLSLFAGGPGALASYSAGAPILTDDRMTLEFSAPRDIHGRESGETGAMLMALAGADGGPSIVRAAKNAAGAREWRNRAAMMAKRDAHAIAYDDYVRALTLDPSDSLALDGLVRTAIVTERGSDALAWIKSLTATDGDSADVLVAMSRLLAAIGEQPDALDAARKAAGMTPPNAVALEQLASLFADAGDSAQLEATVARLREVAPDRPGTHYYGAVAAFLRGKPDDAVRLAERTIGVDPAYAPVYDLLGAAYTKLGQAVNARDAFLASLRLDAHDSTAYTNLGLLELAAGNREEAARYFAEALWLVPDSEAARQGLAQARR
jgi:spermidine synthase